MSELGVGYMIQRLGGNSETVDAYHASLGKTIASARLDEEMNGGDGTFILTFTDGFRLLASDGARSCCEARYMVCDDDLSFMEGAKLLDLQVLDGPEMFSEHGEPHETKFLKFLTDKGNVVISNHNEHNGWYGGISLQLNLETV